MGGTFTKLTYHVVFSTKHRQPLITEELRPRFYDYLGGIVRKERGVVDEIGGMPDHVHLLVRWRPDESLSKLLQVMKSRSSGWVHRTFREVAAFEWQEGYSAFTVSESQCEKVSRYIRNQENHHKKTDFKEELRGLLKAHGLEYDEKYIWL